MIKPVILWTDALIFLLLSAVIVFSIYARGKPYLRAPWQHVLRSRIAASSLVILLLFITTGLLDSLHFRPPLADNGKQTHYAVEVLSVLDVLVGPLRTRVEKTYSAPFSTHLYTRENIEQPDGSVLRDYPRLEYAGSHLADPARDRGADILKRSVMAVVQTLPAAGLLLLGVASLLGRKSGQGTRAALQAILQGRTEIPWRVILVTQSLLLLLLLLAVNLGGAYHILGTD
jgi:peptide/nickel transport system permease protein